MYFKSNTLRAQWIIKTQCFLYSRMPWRGPQWWQSRDLMRRTRTWTWPSLAGPTSSSATAFHLSQLLSNEKETFLGCLQCFGGSHPDTGVTRNCDLNDKSSKIEIKVNEQSLPFSSYFAKFVDEKSSLKKIGLKAKLILSPSWKIQLYRPYTVGNRITEPFSRQPGYINLNIYSVHYCCTWYMLPYASFG